MVRDGLSNWQEAYLTRSQGYPIVSTEEHIVPLLREPFTRAVILRSPQFMLKSSDIGTTPNSHLAERYWRDAQHERGRLAAGPQPHPYALTTDIILADSVAASIVIDRKAIEGFTEKCNAMRAMLARVYNQYAPEKPFDALSSFTLFTPRGGRGRSPELHIDNTVLTLHWAAALAKFSVYDGVLSDDHWQALSMSERKKKSPEDQKKDIERLIHLAGMLPMVENEIGDVTITKGQLGLDLSDPKVRQGVCVHVSSRSIIENGQAGHLITPAMPKP